MTASALIDIALGMVTTGTCLLAMDESSPTDHNRRFAALGIRQTAERGARGPKALAGHPGESATEGRNGLRERLAGYAAVGAGFAKWRRYRDRRERCQTLHAA